MKTIKFKLFATMITLAAVTLTTAYPAKAQRRSSQRESDKREARRSTNRKTTVQQKSTFKNYDKVDRSRVNNDLKKRRSTPAVSKQSTRNSSRSKATPSTNYTSRATRSSAMQRKNNDTSSGRTFQKDVRQPANHNKGALRNNSADMARNSSNVTKDNRSARVATSTEAGRRNTGRTVSDKREYYGIDRTDRRYSPNNNYRGSGRTWNDRYRPGNMNYNHSNQKYYAHYNYHKSKHWDHRWEQYRWNYGSWVDYYRGYNPYSYRYHRYYYHHPRYGHVIRRFEVMPVAFYHDHRRYYCYNGHFFNFRPGIGYILVDLPYGFTFDYLPGGYYERVYINGYLYFRVGNLFFESTGYGFRLVHYPERYYAYDDSYYHSGLRLDIDIDFY
jgi:hypothetical protein